MAHSRDVLQWAIPVCAYGLLQLRCPHPGFRVACTSTRTWVRKRVGLRGALRCLRSRPGTPGSVQRPEALPLLRRLGRDEPSRPAPRRVEGWQRPEVRPREQMSLTALARSPRNRRQAGIRSRLLVPSASCPKGSSRAPRQRQGISAGGPSRPLIPLRTSRRWRRRSLPATPH